MNELKLFNPKRMFVGAFVPNWLMESTSISPTGKLVYARLCLYCDEDGIAWPSLDTLSASIGTSKSTVQRALRELKDATLIVSTRQGLGLTNTYGFVWHDSMNYEKTRVVKDDHSEVVVDDHQQEQVTRTRDNNTEKRFKTPTEDECVMYAGDIGIGATEGKKFFAYWESRGWTRGRYRMKSWEASMRYWKLNLSKDNDAKRRGDPHSPSSARPPSPKLPSLREALDLARPNLRDDDGVDSGTSW